ncbi:hypothetical protein [Pseudoalteromonas obscura]|uniref:Tetratricopeptide repeat protein n=1 Tax=Pseudoalteromonas obscura TaxID=3048491 RepID=A0ABT7EM71_9GAMM|nr:hypothetical protein [Pseudoalteromonas sp. P94(2023)]MDK2596154.1 hypothetical protein [Pseudoalteromonas sp. P94(2023)]
MKYLNYLLAMLIITHCDVFATVIPASKFEADPKEVKHLALNYPTQAIEYYKKNSEKLLQLNSAEALSIYSSLLAAASKVQDIELIEELAQHLSDERLVPYSQPYTFTVVNVIGVAYRLTGQLDDAIKTYKCALKHSQNNVEKMTAKVNLAIAYRMNNQPAISFQILQSVDEAILNGRRKAGLLVVKGNTAIVLGNSESAVEYFIAARRHYLADKHHRNATRVTVNLLGAALIERKVELYENYREKLRATSDTYLPDSDKQYLKWLDFMAKSVKSNMISEQAASYTTRHVDLLLKGGYENPVRKILKSLNAEFLIPQEPKKRPMNKKLQANLAKRWCQDL